MPSSRDLDGADDKDAWPEWNLLFAVFSSERSDQYLDVLHLHIGDTEYLRHASRQYVSVMGPKWRGTWRATSRRWHMPRSRRSTATRHERMWDAYRDFELTKAIEVLDSISEAYGTEIAYGLAAIAGALDPSIDRNSEEEWYERFEVLSHLDLKADPLFELIADAVSQTLSASLLSKVNELVSSGPLLPVDDWDRRLDSRLHPLYPPFELLTASLESIISCNIWRALEESVGPVGLERTVQWARQTFESVLPPLREVQHAMDAARDTYSRRAAV